MYIYISPPNRRSEHGQETAASTAKSETDHYTTDGGRREECKEASSLGSSSVADEAAPRPLVPYADRTLCI